MFDDFWKIAGCIAAGTIAYSVGKNNGQTKAIEKISRDQEIAELKQKIAELEKKAVVTPPNHKENLQ